MAYNYTINGVAYTITWSSTTTSNSGIIFGATPARTVMDNELARVILKDRKPSGAWTLKELERLGIPP